MSLLKRTPNRLKLLFWSMVLFPTAILAQETITKKIYLDSLYQETNYENHLYYRIIESYDTAKELFQIKDYYKSGVIQMTGQSTTNDGNSKVGEIIFYYENGNKKSNINYYKGRLVGIEEQWYENGAKQVEAEYLETNNLFTTVRKIKNFWKFDGTQTVVNGNGTVEETSENGSEKGAYKNGLKDSIWTGTFSENYGYTEDYKNGELVSGVSTDRDNNQYRYTQLEVKPEPLKGMKDFYKHVGKNFQIPRVYDSVKGKIITTFIVEKTGELVEIKIIKSLFETLDEEAIRVIKSYGKWKPGMQRGQNVRVLYSLPISLAGSR